MFGYIYLTTNLVNGRKYIGQKRYTKNHEAYLGSGKLIKAAIEKYGAKNFKKEILEECETREELNKAEIKWISNYNAVKSKEFYNLASGGEGQINPSPEIIAKIVAKNIGRKHTEETKRKQSEAHKGEKAWQYGKHLSEEHRKHLSEHHWDSSGKNNPNYGKKMSDEQKAKISAKLAGKCYLTENGRKIKAEKVSKPVYCITNDTYYQSGLDAARKLELDSSIISKVCKGKIKTTKGFVFRYATKEEVANLKKGMKDNER